MQHTGTCDVALLLEKDFKLFTEGELFDLTKRDIMLK